MPADIVSRLLPALQPSSPLRAGGLALAALVAVVPTVLLLILARYLAVSAFNLTTDYFCLGRYGNIPRCAHKGPWTELIRGDLPRVIANEPGVAHRDFVQEAGSNVLVSRMLFWKPRLLLVDAEAMLYVLSAQRSYSFPKPEMTRRFLARSLGDGLIVVEGDKHKAQRKIIQPAFSTSAIRELMPAFSWHARRLVDRLGRTVDACQGPSDTKQFLGQTNTCSRISEPGAPVLDVCAYISRCTLDVIADTGFDTQFDSILRDDPTQVNTGPRKVDAMSDAFQNVFTPFNPIHWEIAMLVIRDQPGLSWLRHFRLPFEAQLDRMLAVIQDLAMDIVNAKRKQILDDMASDEKPRLSKADWEDAAPATGNKDLLFRMMRSNMSHDITEAERMTDSELLGQLTTLLLAGHETTSTLLCWTLLMLARHPATQTKLREEMRQFVDESGRETLTYEDLAALPYLDAVIKETLRMRSPVPSTIRVAAHDAVIPLSRPYPTRDGKSTLNHVFVKKGEEVFMPLLLINTSQELWGPDALSFVPERWYDIPSAAKASGMPLHLMSFISGPRGCIGNRFALAEAKSILFSLILNFTYEPIPDWEIEGKQAIVMRFRVKGHEDDGYQMPLRIRRVEPH